MQTTVRTIPEDSVQTVASNKKLVYLLNKQYSTILEKERITILKVVMEFYTPRSKTFDKKLSKNVKTFEKKHAVHIHLVAFWMLTTQHD